MLYLFIFKIIFLSVCVCSDNLGVITKGTSGRNVLIWDGVLPRFCVRDSLFSERGKAGHISGKIMLCEVQGF